MSGLPIITPIEEFELEREKLKRSWDSQQPDISAIIDKGFARTYAINSDFFAKMGRKLACVDGRTLCSKIAIPGSGVLMSDAEREETAKLLKKARVEISGVHPHHGCGAEAKARRLLLLQGKRNEEVDEEISRRYRHMAELLGVKVEPPAEMRHMHFHNERSLILSGVDHFDPFRMGGHLTPFLVNARFMPSLEDALGSVPFCIEIAIGSGGYGLSKFIDAIEKDGDGGKFIVVIIGNPNPKKQYSCRSLSEQLLPYIKEYEYFVKIVEYEVPAEMLK